MPAEKLSLQQRRPLDGLRVIDCATFIAGPYAATLLGEFGAEVIKIEQPKVGDPLRNFGTRAECGETLPWLSESRNKKSVTLDLRKPEGAALFKQLIARSDVLCENFQTGTLESWGLGWETLRQVNPRLVMVRITGYGQTGPYAARPGFARIAQAFGGLSYLAGWPDRAPVTPGSSTIADYMSGLYGAFGALMALEARRTTGEGQVVDIGLYESIFRILDELVPAWQLKGYQRERMGPGTVNVVPHSHYPSGDGKWVAIACTSDKIFERLARAMGRPELAGEGIFGTIAKREAAREQVDTLVSEWTSARSRQEVIGLCDEAQVPAGPLNSISEIFEDPQFRARENIAFVKDERVGELAVPNVTPRLAQTPGRIDSLGPSLGSHNDEVLRGMLGVTEERMNELAAAGVI
jgi:crotonobetainyl-CoA:carnitine CoA-transferase CaiB-like acyl-CoA transferase